MDLADRRTIINDKWLELGGASSVLGSPESDGEEAKEGGAYQHFQGGSIYWHPATGAHEVHGAIRDKWMQLGWENGPLGYPTTDEGDAKDGGRYSHFQGGSIYWHSETGAHEVHGAIRDKWMELSWENGQLGFPTTDEGDAKEGGRYSHFQGGSIYWHPATGSHEVHGAIRDKWMQLDWENGLLGFPTTDEQEAKDRGRFQRFQGGSLFWYPDTGAIAASSIPELDELIGLSNVKAHVRELVDVAVVDSWRRKHNLPRVDQSFHLVFTGNPGTGKTTVARILGSAYEKLGLLSSDHVEEVAREDLVAGYIGQTALKTAAAFQRAKGGILFVDEAAELASEDDRDFGNEAIATINKLMEDNRDDTMVIMAGYPKPMEKLLTSNDGLRSRFQTTITFPDYRPEELCDIFLKYCDDKEYILDEAAVEVLLDHFELTSAREKFGNARDVRTLLARCITAQSSRLAQSGEPDRTTLRRLLVDDVVRAVNVP